MAQQYSNIIHATVGVRCASKDFMGPRAGVTSVEKLGPGLWRINIEADIGENEFVVDHCIRSVFPGANLQCTYDGPRALVIRTWSSQPSSDTPTPIDIDFDIGIKRMPNGVGPRW